MTKIELIINKTTMPVSISTVIPVVQGGSAFSTYTHNQIPALAEWDVVHNLSCYPSVSIVDTGGNVVHGDIKYISENELIITFSNAFSGKAYIN